MQALALHHCISGQVDAGADIAPLHIKVSDEDVSYVPQYDNQSENTIIQEQLSFASSVRLVQPLPPDLRSVCTTSVSLRARSRKVPTFLCI